MHSINAFFLAIAGQLRKEKPRSKLSQGFDVRE